MNTPPSVGCIRQIRWGSRRRHTRLLLIRTCRHVAVAEVVSSKTGLAGAEGLARGEVVWISGPGQQREGQIGSHQARAVRQAPLNRRLDDS